MITLSAVARHNLRVAPVVLLVRLPFMVPLIALVWLGEKALAVGDHLQHWFPSFKRAGDL